MANQTGKRYQCTKCGSEFIVTRGGNGTLKCCGQPMQRELSRFSYTVKQIGKVTAHHNGKEIYSS